MLLYGEGTDKLIWWSSEFWKDPARVLRDECVEYHQQLYNYKIQ